MGGGCVSSLITVVAAAAVAAGASAPLPMSLAVVLQPMFLKFQCAQACTDMPEVASDGSAAVVEAPHPRPCTDVPGQGSYETRLHACLFIDHELMKLLVA